MSSIPRRGRRFLAEAAALGVLQVHLSGGEPRARRDLVQITAAAHDAGLYTNLITSAVGITADTLQKLADAGLDHVQISIQDSTPTSADHIAGYDGAFARKRALAAEVVGLKISLTVNVVVHRASIDRIEEMVALALALGASRVEIAHVQYYGWALRNRTALMPSTEQVKHAAATVEDLRKRHLGEIVIDAVVPDYYARLPKPCVGGWGRRSLNVTPAGKVLPCHAAESSARTSASRIAIRAISPTSNSVGARLQGIRAAGRSDGPHAAALGMRFYTGSMFPSEYRDQIFVARHGSWNKTKKFGGDIALVKLNKDGSVKSVEPFITGFLQPDNNYVGRPVDVMNMPDGSMLISDDWNGAVWRVTYGPSKKVARR